MEKLEYEGNVKNMLLDPVLDVKNNRSEFRLDNDDSDRVVLSSLRINGLGVSKAGGGHYNFAAGSYGLIKNIFLMDGNVVLDQCLNANGWMAFQNYLDFNDDNACKTKALAKHNLGYMVDGQSPADDVLTAGAAPRTDVIYRSASGLITNNADSLTDTGYLDLKRVLPMLGAVDVLPLAVFDKGLRIVIEYESNANKFLGDTANASSTIRPILSFDELTDPNEKAEAAKGFKGGAWLAIIHDRVNVPSVASGAANVRPEQSVNVNVKNFRGKYLQKIVVAKNPKDAATFKAVNQNSPMGAHASVLGINEKMNFKINGAPKLPLDADRPNKRLALLTDAWGVCNSYPLCNDHGSDRNYFILASFDDASDRKLEVGVQDYFGLSIEDQIRDMELSYTRTNEGTGGTDNEQYNSALDLNMWGLCRKQIVVGNGKYQVVYA